MKKLLLSLMMVGAGIAASAQTSPVKFGVKAGVTFPTVSTEESEVDAKSNLSFYIGGTVDLPVSEMFSIQPGLILSGKGDKEEISESGPEGSYTVSAKTTILYVEVPVNAIVSFPVGNGKIFLGAGPYYAMAVSGKVKATYDIDVPEMNESGSESEDIKFGKDGDMKRGDYGVNFLGGYQLRNGFNIHAGYGLGLGNISHDSDAKVNNRVLSVGIGFSF